MTGSSIPVNVHASCVAIRGRGVLLLGPSHAGKSDLALRLLDGGAQLLADDRCELFVRGGKLHARPPRPIAGLLELRGIGIIRVAHIQSAAIAMTVRLGRKRQPRLPEPEFYAAPKALSGMQPVPQIMVNGAEPSAPARIRAALDAFARGAFRDTFNLE